MLSFERNSHQGTWTEPRNIHVGGLSKDRAQGGTALFPSNNAMAPGRANNSIRPVSCEFCGTTRSDAKDLLRHIRAAHINSNYPCTCRKSYTRKDNYIRHLRECKVKHDKGPFFCFCGKKHSISDEHLAHIQNCRIWQPGRSSLRRIVDTKQPNISCHSQSSVASSRRPTYPQISFLPLTHPVPCSKIPGTISKDNTAGESERSARLFSQFGQARRQVPHGAEQRDGSRRASYGSFNLSQIPGPSPALRFLKEQAIRHEQSGRYG